MAKPRAIVGCECSGRVRQALRRRGIDAWSCDTQPAEDGSEFHIQGDVRDYLASGWDAAVFHPECTFLTLSSVRWLFSTEPSTPEVPKGPQRWVAMIEAAEFYKGLRDCGIPHIWLENPIMHGYAKRIIHPGPRQIVHPHHFGDPFLKATGFELVNAAPLIRTHWMKVPKPKTPEHAAWSACHREGRGPNRKKNRSRTYPGIAEALAYAVCRSLGWNELREAA